MRRCLVSRAAEAPKDDRQEQGNEEEENIKEDEPEADDGK
jgi:hypothetical protein